MIVQYKIHWKTNNVEKKFYIWKVTKTGHGKEDPHLQEIEKRTPKRTGTRKRTVHNKCQDASASWKSLSKAGKQKGRYCSENCTFYRLTKVWIRPKHLNILSE